MDCQAIQKKEKEKLYQDVVGGSIPFEKREQGKQLLEDVKGGLIKYVVVHSIDRLSYKLSYSIRITADITKKVRLQFRR